MAEASGTPSRLKTLPPAYFALVMATGIVSIAAVYQGVEWLAWGLLVLNVFQYLLLWVALLVRCARYRDAVLADAADHLRGPGFFTLVAATGVLSSQFFVVAEAPLVGMGLGVMTAILWAVVIYTIFAMLIVKAEKPAFEKAINGGWLVAIVATQAVSIVSTYIGNHLQWNESILLFGGLLAWSFGVMLYVWIISLIFYRYMFFKFDPGDLSPPYWINMGAVAISTLAGCALIGSSAGNALLLELRPFIMGVTFLLWATATWWIPMLLLLGFWRHVIRRFPLKYDPLYWGMVFPLGMYSVCTFRLGQEFSLGLVRPLALAFFVVAVAVWTIVFGGMLREIFLARPAVRAASPAIASTRAR